MIFFALVAVAAAQTILNNTFFPPTALDSPQCSAPVNNRTLYYDLLEQSTQMPAQVAAQRVGVPFATLVAFVAGKVNSWPTWNPLFSFVNVSSTSLCAVFDNVGYTNAPKVNFPPGMTAPHFIDRNGFSSTGAFAIGWTFRLLDSNGGLLVFGRHTYTFTRLVDQSGVEATVVESFEKAAGPQLATRANAYAWTVALQESLLDGVQGFVCLERVFAKTGTLKLTDVVATCQKFVA